MPMGGQPPMPHGYQMPPPGSDKRQRTVADVDAACAAQLTTANCAAAFSLRPSKPSKVPADSSSSSLPCALLIAAALVVCLLTAPVRDVRPTVRKSNGTLV